MNVVKQQCKFFGIKGEIKGSDIKIRHRKKLLQTFSKVEGVHQVFLVEDVRKLSRVDFGNKETVSDNNVRFYTPALFVIRDQIHKTINLVIRGTWCIEDFVTDFTAGPYPFKNGSIHKVWTILLYSCLGNGNCGGPSPPGPSTVFAYQDGPRVLP